MPPRQRRKEARPQELLDAALELFAEKGFAATRSEEVAARAGVSKGTLYLYYPSKEELLKAVIQPRLSVEIAAVAEHSSTSSRAPAASLLTEAAGRTGGSVCSTAPPRRSSSSSSPRCATSPSSAEFYAREVVEPGQKLIGRILERGIAAAASSAASTCRRRCSR